MGSLPRELGLDVVVEPEQVRRVELALEALQPRVPVAAIYAVDLGRILGVGEEIHVAGGLAEPVERGGETACPGAVGVVVGWVVPAGEDVVGEVAAPVWEGGRAGIDVGERAAHVMQVELAVTRRPA